LPGLGDQLEVKSFQKLAGDPIANELNALMRQGQALHQKGDFSAAQALYQQVLVRDPQNFDALNLLGVIAAGKRNYELAVQLMGKAVKINPDQAMLHFNLGLALHQIKRFDEAVSSFRCAIAIKPDFGAAHMGCGVTFLEAHRPNDALRCFDCAVALSPEHAQAHFYRANALFELKRFREAAEGIRALFRFGQTISTPFSIAATR